jgi:DNA-binding response OmpR family regulator
MLPVMDGFDVLKRIRNGKLTFPVIILTARGEVDDKIRGMDTGADDYLTKPFEMEELFARIRMVTRRGKSRELDNNLHAGDTTLDTAAYELSCRNGGESIKLGSTEYQVLEYLMTNAGQVMSREQITEKVWGYDSEAEYNNVDVYISFLRKKLKFVGSDLRIRAVRGVGYVLETDE